MEPAPRTQTQSVSVPVGSSHVLIVEAERSHRHDLPSHGTLSIGRADTCDIVLSDGSVSRHHADLLIESGHITIRDGGSHNGTCVNGVVITETHRLASGDVVLLGTVALVLHTKVASNAIDAQHSDRGSVVLGPADLVAKLEHETQRAKWFQRPLAIVAIAVPPGAAQNTHMAALVSESARAIDSIGWTDDGLLVVVCPELNSEQAQAFATTIVEATSSATDELRIGVAGYPHDGNAASTLVTAARTAATCSQETPIVLAEAAIERINFDDGTSVVVADPAVIQIFELLKRLAMSDIAVLVTGETGVGKEIAARALHSWSHRNSEPFIAINCAALPETLLESQLFGHAQGAFSGATSQHDGLLAAANGGTVFFDEVGELPLGAQAKLLRAIDTKQITRVGEVTPRTIDARIVAATNRDLQTEVAAGRFRSDLLFRINAARVLLPPLRERQRELTILARNFLAAACKRCDKQPLLLSDATLQAISAYGWPGNIRELKNAMEFIAASITTEPMVEPWHLPSPVGTGHLDTAQQQPTDQQQCGPTPAMFRPIGEELEELERQRMSQALAAVGGVQTRAADLIGMPRRTFTVKLRRYGLR